MAKICVSCGKLFLDRVSNLVLFTSFSCFVVYPIGVVIWEVPALVGRCVEREAN